MSELLRVHTIVARAVSHRALHGCRGISLPSLQRKYVQDRHLRPRPASTAQLLQFALRTSCFTYSCGFGGTHRGPPANGRPGLSVFSRSPSLAQAGQRVGCTSSPRRACRSRRCSSLPRVLCGSLQQVYWTWITSLDGALSRWMRTLSTVAFRASRYWPGKNRCMPLRGGALFGCG